MSKLDSLVKYFATGTTEGDKNLLPRIFIAPEQLPEVLAVQSGSPRLLVGNKGVGKSAILEWVYASSKSKKIPAIFLRPDDLDTEFIEGTQDVSTIKRAMYECFLDAISTSIGRSLSGLLTGEAAELYRDCVNQGSRSPDWMAKLLTILNAIAKPVTSVDFIGLADDLARNKLPKDRLVEVVQNYLLSEDTVFMVLFDDTDQVASPNEANHLNRIWGLLLAIRKLASECPNIKCIFTLRTEVWMRLLRNEHGQRDQIDHFRPLVMMLRAPEQLLMTIFYRRIALAAGDSGYNKGVNVPLSYFFEDEWMTLPTSNERRSWDQFLVKSSRERPRDMIQFVHHLAQMAKARNSELIGAPDAEQAMVSFSRERTEDLAIEMGFDCPQFLDVLRTFSDIPFECDFEELRSHLRSIPSRFSVSVNRRTLKPGQDEDAILLLSLLHESGFINARVRDTSKTRDYRHVTFLDDSNLVQMSRWNELQAAQWEVHPVFRSYILGLIRQKELRR